MTALRRFASARNRDGLCAALLIGCVLSTSIAWAGSPRVTVMFPSGGQRGAEIEIECKGSHLADATGMLFDEPGFEATVLGAEKDKLKVKVKVPEKARLGEHTARIVTASGVADLRLFYVSPFPMVAEVESKDAPDKAQPLPLGATAYGRTQGEDQDRFEVEVNRANASLRK
jgi:hypothetical protein